MGFRSWAWAGCIAISALLSGCWVFETYPNQMQHSLQDLQQNDIAKAIKQMPTSKTFNQDLDGLELGRLEQLNGQYQDSLNTYNQVIASVEAQNMAPKIQVSRILANSSAILVNDNVIPYVLSGYEIVLLYEYQALNYLALGDQQNALVMLRKAQLAQTFLAQQHYKEVTAANKAAEAQSFKISASNYPKQYAQMMDASSAIKSSFINPFSDYLASVLYAASGDTNNSVVSLKNALAVAPNNVYLQQAFLQGLSMQGGDSMLSEYLKAYGLTKVPALPDNAGTLVVIYEQGLVPAMQQVQIPIPIPGGMVTVSFPYYDSQNFPAITPMSISANGKSLGQTALLTNNALLAQKALTEDYPLIIFRMVMRLAAQAAAMTAAANQNNNGGDAANLSLMVYSLLTANADLRSWLTLPDNVQILQLPLSAGQYTLTLGDSAANLTSTVQIENSKITLVWVMGTLSPPKVLTFSL